MRARTKKRKRRFRFLPFLFLAGIAGAALYYALSLPIWKIQEINVVGTSLLSAEEIRDLAGIPLSGNLFFSSFARARGNLKKIPAIEEAHFYRIPPAAVIIRVKERKPIAAVIFRNFSALIDRSGFIINRNPNLTLNVPNLADLPVISGVGTIDAPGENKIDPQISALVPDIISQLGSRRVHLELGGFEKISFLLDDILRVKIGRNENIKRKMEVFTRLLPEIGDRRAKVEYVDVRYPDTPVIKFK